MKGGSCDGYAKGGKVKGAAKIAKVMGEFKAGTLHSGSKKGPEVKNPKQAVAIAMSEARKAGAKMPMKKAEGGGVFNERGKRATAAEVAAEGRRVENEMAARTAARMAKRKPPVEGISTRPTDDSGRRMTNEELGMTPGGVAPKKPMPKKAVPAYSGKPVIRRSNGGLTAMPKGKC